LLLPGTLLALLVRVGFRSITLLLGRLLGWCLFGTFLGGGFSGSRLGGLFFLGGLGGLFLLDGGLFSGRLCFLVGSGLFGRCDL
jgi:hypothetical protein